MRLTRLVEKAGWHYLPASAVAFTAGAGVVYLISVRFIFRVRVVGNRAAEFSYFLLFGVVGLLVNAAALAVAIGVLSIGLVTAKLIATTIRIIPCLPPTQRQTASLPAARTSRHCER